MFLVIIQAYLYIFSTLIPVFPQREGVEKNHHPLLDWKGVDTINYFNF
jgi:hypothetical protein